MYAALRSEKTKFFSFGWCILGVIGAIIVPLHFLLTSRYTKDREREGDTFSLLASPLFRSTRNYCCQCRLFWTRIFALCSKNNTSHTTIKIKIIMCEICKYYHNCNIYRYSFKCTWFNRSFSST